MTTKDPVEELVETLTMLREDVTRLERQNAGLATAVQAAQKAAERIGPTVGAEAGRVAAERVGPLVAELRAAARDAHAAAGKAQETAGLVGQAVSVPFAVTASLALLVAFALAFYLGYHYGPGDWRACPSDRLVAAPDGAVWCRLK